MSLGRLVATAFVVFVFAAPFSGTGRAQDLGLRSYGLRGGISLNPDQFSFGAHADIGRIADGIRLQPSAELGFGNGVLLASANFDAHYLLAPRSFRPYVGGGVGLNFVDVRSGIGSSNGLGVEPVVNAVGGVEWGERRNEQDVRRYLLEARLGFGDTPELKLVFGLSF